MSLFPFLLTKNNAISSPGLLGERLHNLQRVQYDEDSFSKFGQQQLAMVNYVCGLNQSETEKYFEWVIKSFMYVYVKAVIYK